MSTALAPLSHRQQGLWIAQRLENARTAYNVTMAFELRGQVDPELLSRAFAILVNRHDALRTKFVTVLGETHRRVLSTPIHFELATEDLTHANPQLTGEHVAEAVREERRTPFDLADTAPLLRGRLVMLGPAHHVLILTTHHIAFDGWSQRLLMRELGELYRDLTRGRAEVAPPPASTYSDYTQWQREWMAGAEAQKQEAYWIEQLAGIAPLLQVPTDRPRPVEQDYSDGRVDFALDTQLTAALKALATHHRISLYTVLLTGWAVVVSRLSGQDDVVIGVLTANRRQSQYTDVIGYFSNVLAVRVTLSGAPSVTALCQRTYASLREALAHSELPFERVVERLNPPRSLSHSPIVQTTVTQVPSLESLLELPGIDVAPFSVPDTAAVADFTLRITDRSDQVVGYLDYAAALFDEATARRYAKYLQHVLRQFAEQPDRALVDVSLLDADERQELIDGSHGDGPATPDRRPIVERYAAQVAHRPNQPAVVDANERLTYLELDRRANGVAHALAGRGVGPGQVVGVYADRSAQLLVGILGVLKSGAAYLPLDRGQPVERLTAMVEDAAPAVVLSCVDDCPPRSDLGWDILQLTNIALARAEAPRVAVSPTDLAYVMYTSGSTGRPKGVAVTHGSVMNLFDDWLQRFGATPGEATSAWASIGFDASVPELLLPLSTGAVVYMVPDEVRSDPTALMRWMRERRIVQAFLPPSYITWIGEEPHARLSGLSLRQVPTGVETLDESTLFKIQQALPGLRIQFGYGPTEATVYASSYTEFKPLDRPCPIGRPLPGTRMYVLDQQLRPAPPGVTGEIYLAGASLATGYLHRPDLTCERFVADPFVAGERMYRTGDLARRRADGGAEYIGRSDHQIKLRGFRIELGEIEAALRKVAGTPEAVVLVDHGPSGEMRLVAAIASAQAQPAKAWRTALSTLLPDHMIPEVFVQPPQLPLNRSGKLDRNALLAQARAESQAAVNTESPRDHVEMALYRIWSEVLGQPRVGISDNFFEVGGTSVLAVKLASAIEQEFGRELPIRELMLRPTIEQLAVAVRADSPSSDEDTVIEFRAGHGGERVVCVHPAGGTAFCYLRLSSLLPEHVGVVGVQSPGVNPEGALAPTVEEMARTYLETIRPCPDEALVISGLSYGGVLAYEMARQLAADGHTRVSAVLLDARVAEDAETRAALEPVGPEEFRDKLVRFNGAYPDISDDQLERYFRVYNHHRLTLKSYLPQASSARMVYVQATDSDPDTVAAWHNRSAGQLRFETVDSVHWEMLEGSTVGKIAEIITDELAGIANLVAVQDVT